MKICFNKKRVDKGRITTEKDLKSCLLIDWLTDCSGKLMSIVTILLIIIIIIIIIIIMSSLFENNWLPRLTY